MPMNDDPDAFDYQIDDQFGDDQFDDVPFDDGEEPIDWDALNDAFGD